ncbi:MAG: acetyl-CoA carboxylase biotin carboxyl carrier protein, partial [Bacillota bacterium]|nr:acetyl-CoA carboxylase biotin carboxyl carrier protein [Bacillota bacterium]
MDYKSIEQLIMAAGEAGLDFFELETEGMRITMKKDNDNMVKSPRSAVAEEPVAATAECLKEIEEVVQEVKKETTPAQAKDKNIFIATSPIVGTFYGSSSPDSEAFVKVGSRVKKGQVLCIIEAMKLMNEIDSEVDGEIVEILVENEQMVEYGQE